MLSEVIDNLGTPLLSQTRLDPPPPLEAAPPPPLQERIMTMKTKYITDFVSFKISSFLLFANRLVYRGVRNKKAFIRV